MRGLAFGGSHGIERVEVSADGGATWREATPAPSPPDAWVPWTLEWDVPAPGAYTMMVGAQGRDGVRQAATASRAYPSGTSGLHTIVALVKTL